MIYQGGRHVAVDTGYYDIRHDSWVSCRWCVPVTFDITHVRLMGEHRYFWPFLNTGVTLACFQPTGTCPLANDLRNRRARGSARTSLSSFNTLGGWDWGYQVLLPCWGWGLLAVSGLPEFWCRCPSLMVYALLAGYHWIQFHVWIHFGTSA